MSQQLDKYINNRDLRSAEAMYVAIKSFDGWYMPNIFTYGTREYYAVYGQMSREFARVNRSKCRMDDNLSTAVHECGHAIVGAASALQVHKATIVKKGSWAGHVSYCPEGESAPELEDMELTKDAQLIPNRVVVRGRLLTDAAGFIAEHDNLDRYSTSYHEKLIVYFQTRYLDEQQKKPMLSNWIHFTGWCSRILKENKALFEFALDDILTNKDLSSDGLVVVNAKAKLADVNLFFN